MATDITYKTHPAAELFPPMTPTEIEELATDIRLHGLREPITLHEGRILDGRNRLVACGQVGVEPTFRDLPAGLSPARYVWSMNYTRRHLTMGQRAMAAMNMEKMVAKEAKDRMSRGGLLAVRQGVELIPHPEQGRTRDKLADIANVNPRYIADAQTLNRESPQLAAEVAAGTVTIPEAMRRLKGETGAAKDRADGEASIDAVLLVVDLVVGAEDMRRRKGLLRAVFLGALRRQGIKRPFIVLVNEKYAQGTLQHYQPGGIVPSLPHDWTPLEQETRATCSATPLKARKLKAWGKGDLNEDPAHAAEIGIALALREFNPCDSSSGSTNESEHRSHESAEPQASPDAQAESGDVVGGEAGVGDLSPTDDTDEADTVGCPALMAS